jgi:hypothetical protein
MADRRPLVAGLAVSRASALPALAGRGRGCGNGRAAALALAATLALGGAPAAFAAGRSRDFSAPPAAVWSAQRDRAHGSWAPPDRDPVSDALREAARFVGGGNPTGFRGPWCKAFANFVLRRIGLHPGPSLLAIDALRDGRRVAAPRPGDLAVMAHHVTFFAGFDGAGGFIGLGGNQHHDVTRARFSLGAVVAFIRPT